MALVRPRQLVTAENHGWLTVAMRAATHRFQRDLSLVVEWPNELERPLLVVVTIAPATKVDRVPRPYW
jgi:hypothetical protein